MTDRTAEEILDEWERDSVTIPTNEEMQTLCDAAIAEDKIDDQYNARMALGRAARTWVPWALDEIASLNKYYSEYNAALHEAAHHKGADGLALVGDKLSKLPMRFVEEIVRLRAENAKLATLVKRVEWDGGFERFCPFCIRGYKDGHADECPAKPWLPGNRHEDGGP